MPPRVIRLKQLKILEQLKELSKQRYVSGYTFALVYLGLGDNEEALRWLEKVIKIVVPPSRGIKYEPFLDPLRGDPRFEKLFGKFFRQRGSPI